MAVEISNIFGTKFRIDKARKVASVIDLFKGILKDDTVWRASVSWRYYRDDHIEEVADNVVSIFIPGTTTRNKTPCAKCPYLIHLCWVAGDGIEDAHRRAVANRVCEVMGENLSLVDTVYEKIKSALPTESTADDQPGEKKKKKKRDEGASSTDVPAPKKVKKSMTAASHDNVETKKPKKTKSAASVKKNGGGSSSAVASVSHSKRQADDSSAPEDSDVEFPQLT